MNTGTPAIGTGGVKAIVNVLNQSISGSGFYTVFNAANGIAPYPITLLSNQFNLKPYYLYPLNGPCIMRIYAAFDTAGVLSVSRSNYQDHFNSAPPGGNTVTEQLNDGTSLTANAAYIFDIEVDAGEYFALTYSVAATVLKLGVYEVDLQT